MAEQGKKEPTQQSTGREETRDRPIIKPAFTVRADDPPEQPETKTDSGK